jgi:hypothetical protein
MTNFSKIAATSQAAGFQYFDTQSFSFNVPSVFLAKFVGSLHHQTTTYQKAFSPKVQGALGKVLANIQGNLTNVDAAGVYRNFNNGDSGNKTIGSSGGFPIFYAWNINISFDGVNITFTVDMSNPSAVNDVTTEAFTMSGKVFFYVAPF